MIKIENVEVTGWEHAIRGMRNPMNSWEKGDSKFDYDPTAGCDLQCGVCDFFGKIDYAGKMYCNGIGPNDHQLMMNLAKGGPVHAKYRRMITVYLDITAPLYWWKEFDTYKVGTVANSCSTMHKIHEKEFTLEDFSCEHLFKSEDVLKHSVGSDSFPHSIDLGDTCLFADDVMRLVIGYLNGCRARYLETKDKKYWWQMIQLLPSSYNQKRTVMLNYEVLVGMYESRKNHKLDCWRDFCAWIESLPYSEIIVGGGRAMKNTSNEITIQDCEDLYKRFEKYTETAEQHDFPRLLMVHMMLNKTMVKLRATGTVENQSDARAMFRVVLTTIGEDASAYSESIVGEE